MLALLVTLALDAQVQSSEMDEKPTRLFGLALCAVGDVDGDGCGDLAVVDGYTYDAGSRPALYVISGRDGTVLCETACNAGIPRFGRCVTSLWDFDGDGIDELALLACLTDTPEDRADVLILSPKTGEEVRRLSVTGFWNFLDGSISTTSDIDGDRLPELVLHGYDDRNTGHWSGFVQVVSSVDGRVLIDLTEPHAGEGFARAAVGTGDVNSDGCGDFAISGNHGKSTPSWVRWISGRDGATLQECDDPDPRFGDELDRLEDFDGDGAPELLVGVPQYYGTPERPPFARVISPRNAATLRSMVGVASQNMGACVAAARDLNGDGVSDVLMSSYDSIGGVNSGVVALSGADSSCMLRIEAPKDIWGATGCFGWALCSAGDTNADGWNDFAVTTCSALGPEWPDYLRVYSGRDGALLLTVRPPAGAGR